MPNFENTKGIHLVWVTEWPFNAVLLKTSIHSITVGSFRHIWFISSQLVHFVTSDNTGIKAIWCQISRLFVVGFSKFQRQWVILCGSTMKRPSRSGHSVTHTRWMPFEFSKLDIINNLIMILYSLWPNYQFVTKWMSVIPQTYLVSSSVTHARSQALEFLKSDHNWPRYLTSGSFNPWIITCDEMNQVWLNERWSLAERPCMVIQLPIKDECPWYFQNWTSETLNPSILAFVTKWSICDQMTVGPRLDLLGLFISDTHEITGFGILKIRPQMAKISDIR